MNTRRLFLLRVVSSAGIAAMPLWARAENVRLSESDPEARAQGYHAQSSAVDQADFPMHKPGTGCNSCALLVARHGDGTGRCAIFAEKSVALTGWCTSFTPRDYMSRAQS